jgi:hypothetical protein
MLLRIGILKTLDLTKHHSTEDELLSNFLVLCEGSHVQSTSDDV